MVGFAAGLAARRLDVVTFNFPFTERGKKMPDPQPVLEGCYRAVLAHVAADPVLGARTLFIGGKSLGGRMASHVAAARDVGRAATATWWDRLRGLVFLGYPLHPPGKPQQVRVSHLPQIIHPMLVVQGAKDAFGSPGGIADCSSTCWPPPSEIYVVDQGNHSLEVPKRSGCSAGGGLRRRRRTGSRRGSPAARARGDSRFQRRPRGLLPSRHAGRGEFGDTRRQNPFTRRGADASRRF